MYYSCYLQLVLEFATVKHGLVTKNNLLKHGDMYSNTFLRKIAQDMQLIFCSMQDSCNAMQLQCNAIAMHAMQNVKNYTFCDN